MARPTQYQKLSLQLDAENKKLKAKLAQSKTQMSRLKGEAAGLQKGFGKSFDQIGGKAGMLKGQFTSLVNTVGSIHPAVLAFTGGIAALGLAFKDLTAFTETWEGALSDAGRSLASLQTGTQSFWKLASEQRGQALAEGGIFGWIGETVDQLHGLTTGMTAAAAAVSIGVASVVNDAMLKWQKGLLDTTVETSKLRAQTQELYNQFRDKALLPEERLKAVDTFKAKALDLFKIQKGNAENELKFLEQQSKLSGNSFEDNLKIEQKKAEIADLERQYQKMLGRSIEFEATINNELKKQEASRLKAANLQIALNESLDETINKMIVAPLDTVTLDIDIDDIAAEQLQDQIDLNKELAEVEEMRRTNTTDWAEIAADQQQQVIGGYVTMAEIIGRVANGIANAKNNWAAMAATVLSGVSQVIPQIQGIIEATKVLTLAKQGEAVAGAVSSSQSIPFPGNLVAMASSVAAVLSTIAPFIGSFAKGIDFVPQTGMALIHKGEAVIPANENRRGGNGQLVAVVQGSDLHFVLDEYSRKRNNSF